MDAPALYDLITRHGGHVGINDRGNVVVRNYPLSADLLTELKQQKPGLVALVRAQSNGHVPVTTPAPVPSHTTTFTQIPNVFLEWVAPALSEGQLRVMLYLFRRTVGHHKVSDAVSLTQLCEGTPQKGTHTRKDAGTGMARTSVVRAVNELIGLGLLERRPCATAKTSRAGNTYHLKLEGMERFVKGAD